MVKLQRIICINSVNYQIFFIILKTLNGVRDFFIISAYSKKKDVSQAILEKKKAPHKLTVEEAKNDDNSIIEMTQAKMDELKIFKGDTVLIKGMILLTKFFPHHF